MQRACVIQSHFELHLNPGRIVVIVYGGSVVAGTRGYVVYDFAAGASGSNLFGALSELAALRRRNPLLWTARWYWIRLLALGLV